MMILAKHSDVGNKWVRIASFLPGRPENSVKNRYHSLLRRALKGDQYPIATARKAGGTSFLAAIEAKLGGAAVRKAGGSTTGAAASGGGASRSTAGGSKRRRSPTAASGSAGGGGSATALRSSKVPNHGTNTSAAAALRLQQAQQMQQQQVAMQHLQMQAMMASGGAAGGDMHAAGPYSVQDIAAATNAAIQAADGMGEKLASMDTETQIAMIAAAMTGRAEVEPAVTEQLKRCRPLWTQFLQMQTAMAGAAQYSLAGYPMAFSMAPGLPSQASGVHTVSMAVTAPPMAGHSGAVPHSGVPATTASTAHAGMAMGGQQKVVRDALGRDLSITIPPMPSVSGSGAAANMGFQLAGPMSSSASPTFMFSPGNGATPLNLVSMMHGSGMLSAHSRGDMEGPHAGTPTAFFVSASDGDGAGPTQ